MYATARPHAPRPVSSLDSQPLEETERGAYSVGQAQREPAKASCQGSRITVLQSR